MLYEVLNAILSKLKKESFSVYENYGKILDNYTFPAVFVDLESVDYVNLTRGKYKVILNISVYLLVRNYRSESDMNMQMFNILEGVAGILTNNSFNLEIEPIRPVRVTNISTEEHRIQKINIFKLDIQTSYIVDKPKREEIYGDLLRIGLEYYLKPGDDVEDAKDIITLKDKEVV